MGSAAKTRWLRKLISLANSFSPEQFTLIQREGFKASEDEQIAVGAVEPASDLLPVFQGWCARAQMTMTDIPARNDAPREFLTYASLESALSAVGAIQRVQEGGHLWEHVDVVSDQLMGPIAAAFANEFQDLLARTRLDIRSYPARWKVTPCVSEPDGSCDALASIYQHAARVVITHCTTLEVTSRERTKYCPVLINKSARSADVALSVVNPGTLSVSTLKKQNAYEWCNLFLELKNDRSKLGEARGQVVDRAEKRRKGAHAGKLVVLGGASTGSELEAMVVFTDMRANHRVVRTDSRSLEEGYDPMLGRQSKTEGTVNCFSAALPDILFQTFSLMHLHNKFEFTNFKPCRSAERKYTVRSADWSQIVELKLVDTYVDYLFRGGCYLVEQERDKQQVVLKRGSTSTVRAAGEGLGFPPQFFNQVENEIRVREALRGCSSNVRIPKILWSGWGVEPFHWRECPVIFMPHVGDCLHGKKLPLVDVVDMGQSLLATVKELHQRGIIHRDICPRNVAFREQAVGADRFYLLDLGLAAFGVEISPGKDLEFGCMDSLFGRPVDASGDLESILYAMVKVAGMELPWSAAAQEEDEEAVLAIRQQVLKRGFIADFGQALFMELQDRVFPPRYQAVQDHRLEVSSSPPLCAGS